MSIIPKHITINELFGSAKYYIDFYQREYKWKKEHVLAVLSDIFYRFDLDYSPNIDTTEENIGKFNWYYLNTFLTNIYDGRVFIVDGQQRLTTLIAILKALAKKLDDGDEDEKREGEKLNELLVKADERLILLQTNHDSSSIFRTYLKEGAVPTRESIKTAADKNLMDAFEDCEHFVATWSMGPLSLLKTIKNRIDFVFYVLDDEGIVYSVFEVLNSRGLEVDWLDKCKSMLMGIAFDKFTPEARHEQVDELHKRWTKIYQTIGLRK